MFRTSNDLLVVTVIACLASLAALVGLTWPLGQALLGLSLVLFVPGYALAAALFPPRTLGVPERLLFSVALSLASTMLGSLVLYWLKVGLRPATWALLLTAITLGTSLIAWQRRKDRESAPLALNLSLVQGGTLGLAGLAVVAALTLARVPSSPAGLEGYTLLWILPTDRAEPPGVRLGISSMEFTPVSYRLLFTVDGRPAYEWATISLGPGEKWEEFVPLPAQGAGSGRIEATLYRLDNPSVVYRRVSLWQGQMTDR
jgi:uncharacterized membrane protein